MGDAERDYVTERVQLCPNCGAAFSPEYDDGPGAEFCSPACYQQCDAEPNDGVDER
jgi:hypothetical protein